MTNKEWIDKKLQFIEKYKVAQNAASGSEVDANANVTAKNIATLQSEIVKDDMIQINRAVMEKYLTPLYGEDVVKQFEKDLKNHYIYSHDETGLAPYTYGPHETINVKYKNKESIYTFEELYKIVCEDEHLLDEEKGVWGKYPNDMFILDRYGWTKVERLIKKKRHRDMVKIKIDTGDELIVTDNHPLIISDYVENTVQAIDGMGHKQFITKHENIESNWYDIDSITRLEEKQLVGYDYIYDITTESHSFICNNIWAHNCVAVSLYPFLLNGLKDLGGSSLPPKHADSYIGGMINLIFLLAGQYLGACMYKDQKVFIKKDGKTYSITSKDLYNLIEGNETIFNTLTDQWEYKTVKDIEIYENGKWVKLNKVLRRPYSDDIYNVKTKTGLSVFTSKDHKFKLYEKNNYTLKAEELKIGDKICADVNLFKEHKQIEFDEIVEIDKFVNDDEYVYEVETETHWYNCGGLITHNCAVPEFLPYFDHFLRVDFGDDYIEHLDESVITYGKRKETLRDRIEDWFQQFVYSINQPAGSRNYQSPFVNISYYDKGYFESIFNGFVFPDGDEPKWETTKELQKMFIKWFNKERTKTILTFPVETFNTLFDKTTKKYKDEESADFVADAWAHGHSFFVYNSDSADALSSCCFDYNTPVTIKVEKDKTPVNGYIGSLYEQYHDKSIKTLSNGKWAKAKLIKLPNRPMLKITFLDENKWRKTVVVSDNHLHPTQRGDVETAKLTLNDKLKYAPDIYSKKYIFVDIVSIEPYKYSGDIYCFEMEDQTNPYFTLLNGLITHNCRLKNAIEENVFSYTLGAGGIQTGSKKVITLNLNRIVQDWFNKYKDKQTLNDYITTIVKRVHKYLTAWNHWLWDLYDADLLTVYKAGFISLDKQYLTVGM